MNGIHIDNLELLTHSGHAKLHQALKINPS